MSKIRNVLLISESRKFEANLSQCLVEECGCKTFLRNEIRTIVLDDFIKTNNIEAIILNLLYERKKQKEEIDLILKQNVKKIIILENGNDLYLNCKIKPPFSVYKKLQIKNRQSRLMKLNEDTIQKSNIDFTIFRVSELYGPHVHSGLIFDLLTKRKVMLRRGTRDFVYEGDVIRAIEIALETNSVGIFDIASGNAVDTKDLVDLINKCRKDPVKVKWKRRNDISYNCENFKFYKWQPIVNVKTGLFTIKRFKPFL